MAPLGSFLVVYESQARRSLDHVIGRSYRTKCPKYLGLRYEHRRSTFVSGTFPVPNGSDGVGDGPKDAVDDGGELQLGDGHPGG